MLDALRLLPGVTKADAIDAANETEAEEGIQRYRLYGENVGDLTGAALQAISQQGGELRDLHIARPSLEDVFIYLTGRNLR